MRLKIQEIQDYSNKGSKTDWFKLENNGDTAEVQFLYKDFTDVKAFGVHKVKNEKGWRVSVDCLKDNPTDTNEKCPLCQARYSIMPTLLITMYDHRDKKVKVWQRTPRFKNELKNIIFADGKDVRNKVFRIVRNGDKGSKDTTYTIFPINVEAHDVSKVEIPDLENCFYRPTYEKMQEIAKSQGFHNKATEVKVDKVVSTPYPSEYDEAYPSF